MTASARTQFQAVSKTSQNDNGASGDLHAGAAAHVPQVYFTILQSLAAQAKEFDLHKFLRLKLYLCGLAASQVVRKTNNGHCLFTQNNSDVWVILQHPPGDGMDRAEPPTLTMQIEACQRGDRSLVGDVPLTTVERSFGHNCRWWLYHFELNRCTDGRKVFNMRNNRRSTGDQGRDRIFTLVVKVEGVTVKHNFTVAVRKSNSRDRDRSTTPTAASSPEDGDGSVFNFSQDSDRSGGSGYDDTVKAEHPPANTNGVGVGFDVGVPVAIRTDAEGAAAASAFSFSQLPTASRRVMPTRAVTMPNLPTQRRSYSVGANFFEGKSIEQPLFLDDDFPSQPNVESSRRPYHEESKQVEPIHIHLADIKPPSGPPPPDSPHRSLPPLPLSPLAGSGSRSSGDFASNVHSGSGSGYPGDHRPHPSPPPVPPSMDEVMPPTDSPPMSPMAASPSPRLPPPAMTSPSRGESPSHGLLQWITNRLRLDPSRSRTPPTPTSVDRRSNGSPMENSKKRRRAATIDFQLSRGAFPRGLTASGRESPFEFEESDPPSPTSKPKRRRSDVGPSLSGTNGIEDIVSSVAASTSTPSPTAAAASAAVAAMAKGAAANGERSSLPKGVSTGERKRPSGNDCRGVIFNQECLGSRRHPSVYWCEACEPLAMDNCKLDPRRVVKAVFGKHTNTNTYYLNSNRCKRLKLNNDTLVCYVLQSTEVAQAVAKEIAGIETLSRDDYKGDSIVCHWSGKFKKYLHGPHKRGPYRRTGPRSHPLAHAALHGGGSGTSGTGFEEAKVAGAENALSKTSSSAKRRSSSSSSASASGGSGVGVAGSSAYPAPPRRSLRKNVAGSGSATPTKKSSRHRMSNLRRSASYTPRTRDAKENAAAMASIQAYIASTKAASASSGKSPPSISQLSISARSPPLGVGVGVASSSSSSRAPSPAGTPPPPSHQRSTSSAIEALVAARHHSTTGRSSPSPSSSMSHTTSSSASAARSSAAAASSSQGHTRSLSHSNASSRDALARFSKSMANARPPTSSHFERPPSTFRSFPSHGHDAGHSGLHHHHHRASGFGSSHTDFDTLIAASRLYSQQSSYASSSSPSAVSPTHASHAHHTAVHAQSQSAALSPRDSTKENSPPAGHHHGHGHGSLATSSLASSGAMSHKKHARDSSSAASSRRRESDPSLSKISSQAHTRSHPVFGEGHHMVTTPTSHSAYPHPLPHRLPRQPEPPGASIDRVLNKRRRPNGSHGGGSGGGSVVEFYVSWAGADPSRNSWQPANEVPQSLVDEFEASMPRPMADDR